MTAITLTGLPPDPGVAWRTRAACTTEPTSTFFERATQTYALTICAACPVAAPCLAATLHAEATDARLNLYGVAGGTTPSQRRRWFAAHPDLRPGLRRSHAVCGTDGGYYRHLRNGEPTCSECRAAHTLAEQQRAERRARRNRPELARSDYQTVRILTRRTVSSR